jgi:tetratricopeptide (TPR) repeat protein/tRNA A-37 threonylcarbamoyl transferase component Bud32
MVGKQISHYRILEKIGEGGMGEVYLAVDVKLGRKVALKFLPKKLLENKEARERFKREARATAVFNHPNIVTIHEIDEFEELIYIVMEYIEGETLGDRLEGKEPDREGETVPLSVLQLSDVISIILEVGKGLARAHKAGIVHRDIKLDNILIGRDGMVKILDFGLAKLKGGGDLTEESVAMGTAYYMAPEQLKGGAVDHRVDIWSLGVVMYVLTSGQLPFQGKSAMEAIYSIMKREPAPVSRLNSTIPLEFERIVNRCLQKDPRKRYQDVSDMIADLMQLKDGLPAERAGVRVNLAFIGNFFRTFSPKIAVPVLALSLALIFIFLFPSQILKVKKWLGFEIIPGEKSLALLPFKPEGSAVEQALCDGLVESLARKFKCFEQFDKNIIVILSKNIYRRGINSSREARKFFGVNMTIGGTVRRENDFFYLTLNLVDARKLRPLDSCVIRKQISELADLQEDIVLEVARMLEIEVKPRMRQILKVGRTNRSGAYDFYLKGRGHLLVPGKLENIDRAIDLFKRAIKIDSDYALAHAGLAEGCLRKYQATKDVHWAEKAKMYCNQAIESADSRLVCSSVTLGKIFRLQGQHNDALRVLGRALEVEPANVEVYRCIARVYEAQGNFKEAEKIYRKITRLRSRDYIVQNYLGAFYYRQSRLEEALRAFQKTVKLNPHYIGGLSNLGTLYFSLRRWQDARQMFEQLLSIMPTYETYSNLGTIYFYEGLYRDAARMYRKALDKKDIDYQVWGNMAESYYWTPGERDKSLPHYQRAIDLAKKELQGKPDDPEILSFLASYYGRLSNLSQTLAVLERLESLHNLIPAVMFRIADTYEQIGKRDLALHWIKAAIENGYSLAEIEHNPGLFNLRSDKRFREFLKQTKGKKRLTSMNRLMTDGDMLNPFKYKLL